MSFTEKLASLAVYGGPSLSIKLTKPLVDIISRFLTALPRQCLLHFPITYKLLFIHFHLFACYCSLVR